MKNGSSYQNLSGRKQYKNLPKFEKQRLVEFRKNHY